jgi:hypothetical protein
MPTKSKKKGACAQCGTERGPDHQDRPFCHRCWEAAIQAANAAALQRNPRLAVLDDLFTL